MDLSSIEMPWSLEGWRCRLGLLHDAVALIAAVRD